MKKIIGAALLGTMAAGVFADVSFQANARFRADAFSYQSPSNTLRAKDTNGEGQDDNGTVAFADLTDASDDVKLNASTDNAGAQLVFTVKTPTTNINEPSNSAQTVVAKSYQLWLNFGKLRLDAGSYDKRLSKAFSNDGKWKNNLSGYKKPGIWTAFDDRVKIGDTGKEKTFAWGDDAGNIAAIGTTRVNNVMATYAVNDSLTAYGLVYFGPNAENTVFKDDGSIDKFGVTGNGADDNWSSNIWKIPTFALGATYMLDKNSQLVVVGRMARYAKSTKDNPQNSIWTLHADYYSKLNSNLEIEAAYTFGASVYTNNGNFHDANGNDWVQVKHMKAQDLDVFAHGFDFRVRDKLTSELTLLGIVGVNYIHSTEDARRTNRHDSSANYHDSRAMSYKNGAAGKLAYYVTLGADYVMSDTVTVGFQSLFRNDNLFDVDDDNHSVDYWKGNTWVLRPQATFTASKNCFLQTGLEVTFAGFRDHATGSKNAFNTKIALPLVFNISI